jgi:hypothetical protein
LSDLTTYFAVPQPDGRVKVIGNRPRRTGQPIEALTADEFVARSAANWIVWREGRGNVLITVADKFAVTMIETRLQLQ